jgi:hypothetical protein
VVPTSTSDSESESSAGADRGRTESAEPRKRRPGCGSGNIRQIGGPGPGPPGALASGRCWRRVSGPDGPPAGPAGGHFGPSGPWPPGRGSLPLGPGAAPCRGGIMTWTVTPRLGAGRREGHSVAGRSKAPPGRPPGPPGLSRPRACRPARTPAEGRTTGRKRQPTGRPPAGQQRPRQGSLSEVGRTESRILVCLRTAAL